MRRVLAAVAAIAMIIAGFAAYNLRTDPDRGREAVRMWCIPEAKTLCDDIASTQNVVVTVGSPKDVERQLLRAEPGAAPYDVLVTAHHLVQRAMNTPNRPVQTYSIASTPIVAVTRTGQNSCGGDIACLLKSTDSAKRTAIPHPTATALGALAGAAAYRAADLTDATADTEPGLAVEAAIKEGVRSMQRQSLDPLVALTTVRLIDTVFATKAEHELINPAGTEATSLKPATSLQLEAAWLVADPRIATVVDGLKKAATTAKWSGPQSDDKADLALETALANYVMKVVP